MIFINNNFNELNNLQNLINSYYNLSWIEKKFFFYTEISKVHKSLSKQLLYTAANIKIDEVKQFINWTLSSGYYIVGNPNKEICFRLINKDFSLLAQFAISANIFVSELPKNSLIIELHYLISVIKGSYIGSNFLTKLINFQKEVKIPLILYCSKELCSYYENFGFILIGKNSFDEYLLVYGLHS